MRDAAFYQFWHAELDRLFYEGALEPVIVVMRASDGDARAEFQPTTDPCTVTIYEDEEMPDIDAIAVLLHEMAHQRIHEGDILDDEHGQMLQCVAQNHGLAGLGYSLSERARALVEDRLRAYEHVMEAWA